MIWSLIKRFDARFILIVKRNDNEILSDETLLWYGSDVDYANSAYPYDNKVIEYRFENDMLEVTVEVD